MYNEEMITEEDLRLRFLRNNKEDRKEYKEVKVADTFDAKGEPIEGGLFDTKIFDESLEDYYDCIKEYKGELNWYPKEVLGTAAKITLAVPINSISDWEYNYSSGIIIKSIIVLPPEYRPACKDDNGKFIEHIITRLYRNIIVNNNRLKQLIKEGSNNVEEVAKIAMVIARNIRAIQIETERTIKEIDQTTEAGKLAYWVYLQLKWPIDTEDTEESILNKLKGKAEEVQVALNRGNIKLAKRLLIAMQCLRTDANRNHGIDNEAIRKVCSNASKQIKGR